MDIETSNEELVALDGVAVVIHLLHDSALLLLVHRNVLRIIIPFHHYKLTLQLVEEEHEACACLQDQFRNQIHHRRFDTLALTTSTLNFHRRLGMRKDRNCLDFGQGSIHLSQFHLVDDVDHLNQKNRGIQGCRSYIRFIECVQELEIVFRSLGDGFSTRCMNQIGGAEMLHQDHHRMIAILRQCEQIHRTLPLVGILRLTPVPHPDIESHRSILQHLLHIHSRQLIEECFGTMTCREQHARQLLHRIALHEQFL